MTENEILDNMLDLAMDNHEELLAYRAIGTVEELQALKEKQIPKKVIRLDNNGYYDYKCPTCGLPDKDCMGKRYCNCGQAMEIKRGE